MKKRNQSIVYVNGNECLSVKGYRIYKGNLKNGKFFFFSKLNDRNNGILAKFRLARRLFRAEVSRMYHFQNDTWMCIARKAIFRYDKQTGSFEKCCDVVKGSRPMALCQAKDGTIYYGEYCFNPERKEMQIFESKDNGDTWNVAYCFKDGEINHIHGIFSDPYSSKIWVATGDDDEACIFGYTEDGFKTFVRKYEGSQQCRVCVPLFTEKEIIFATDSQYEQNYIKAINRETGEVRNIQAIQGSGIYAAQCGDKLMVSTTVEPSKVNMDQYSHVWYSDGGHKWKEIAKYKKDIWKKTYFQFGTTRFPIYDGKSDFMVYYGRSVKKIDQSSIIIPFKNQ